MRPERARYNSSFWTPWLRIDRSEDSRRVAGHDGPVGHITRNHAARTNDGALSNYDVRQNRGARAYRRAFPDECRLDFPIAACLQLPGGRRRTRVRIVDECHAMSDEDLILDGHTLAHEGVARDLAALADRRVFLDFDERPDLCLVAYLATVEIDELRQLHVLPQLHVRGYR